MFKPFTASNALFKLKPVYSNEQDFTAATNGVLSIFSNPKILDFHPEKSLKTIEDANTYISGTVIGYSAKIHYNHFIFEKETNNVIGVFEISTHRRIFARYQFLNEIAIGSPFLRKTWMVEYYLKPDYWGRGIVSGFLGLIINQIFSDSDSSVSALTNKDNFRSKRILVKHDFKLFMTYDKGNEHWIKTQ